MSKQNRKRGKFQKNIGSFTQKHWVFIGLAAACVVLLIMLISLIFFMNRDAGEDDLLSDAPEQTSSASAEETTSGTTEPVAENSETSDTTEIAEAEEPTETTVQKDNKPKETKPKDNNKETEPEETEPTSTTQKPVDPDNTPAPTVPVQTEPEKTVLSLPYTIPGSNLIIQRVAPYDGIYMEDGSNQESSGVAMMLLKNTGAEAVEYAEITMQYDDKTLTFKVSALPSGAQAVVQAENRASCATGDLTACTANVATFPKLDMAESEVSVVDNGDNSLTIKNLTDAEIVTVRIFYKYYMEDEATFVGGITYTAKISNLPAAGSVTVTPSHFTSEAGKVVMVRTYDTDV